MPDHVVVYWDSSAVLSALFTDAHSRIAKRWADKKGGHLLSTLGYTEVCAVIGRMKREHLLVETLVKAAFKVLDYGPWRKISLQPDWTLIRSLSDKWPLRGADLWHLAAAKSLLGEFPELVLLTFDKQLNVAVSEEGILVTPS